MEECTRSQTSSSWYCKRSKAGGVEGLGTRLGTGLECVCRFAQMHVNNIRLTSPQLSSVVAEECCRAGPNGHHSERNGRQGNNIYLSLALLRNY